MLEGGGIRAEGIDGNRHKREGLKRRRGGRRATIQRLVFN